VRRGASGQVFLRVGDAVMRAVFHHPCDAWLRERITTFAGEDVSIEIVEEAAGPNIDRALEGADVLLHVLHPVTREMMARAPRLKLVQKIGVGLDAIDLDAARDQGHRRVQHAGHQQPGGGGTGARSDPRGAAPYSRRWITGSGAKGGGTCRPGRKGRSERSRGR
jgi:hypothetical protein